MRWASGRAGRRRGACRALGVALLGAIVVADAVAQTPTGSADVRVEVDPSGSISVEERFSIAPGPVALELRALARACAEVEGLSVTSGSTVLPGAVERDGPWLVYRSGEDAEPGGVLELGVRYAVRTRGDAVDVPLFHPTVPIPQRDGEREGTVRVAVRLPDEGGRVAFPHMDRADATTWSGRYAAVPSFVELVGVPAPTGEVSDCTGPATGPWSDGGLLWRFLLLVGIMVAWVPIYQVWARRSTEDGA